MDNDDIAAELTRLRTLARELLRAIERLESRVSGTQPAITVAGAPSPSQPPAAPPGEARSTIRVPSLQMPAVRPKRGDE